MGIFSEMSPLGKIAAGTAAVKAGEAAIAAGVAESL